MFGLGNNAKLQGIGHVALNVQRVLNIIALGLICTASWILIIMTGIKGHFNYFDAANHLFTSSISIFLILSEVHFFRVYFTTTWPVLGEDHGFTWLGFAMIVMGHQTLSYKDKEQTGPSDKKGIGMPMWRLVFAAGVLAITFGLTNLFWSMVFHERKTGVNARLVRSEGSLATAKASAKGDDYYSNTNSSVHKEKRESRWPGLNGLKLPNRASIQKLKISKPFGGRVDAESGSGDEEFGGTRGSPVMPGLQRPPTAMHPAYTATDNKI